MTLELRWTDAAHRFGEYNLPVFGPPSKARLTRSARLTATDGAVDNFSERNQNACLSKPDGCLAGARRNDPNQSAIRRMEISLVTSGPPDRLPAALDYSWKWFSYHADQRLKAFNFYLVIVGVLVVGYLKCLELGLRWPSAVIAGFGAVVSLAFWILDIRNTELVNYGRVELENLENKFDVAIRTNDKKRTKLRASMGHVPRFFFGLLRERPVSEDSLTDTLTKHQTWLRVIIVIGLLAFVMALVMTMAGVGIGAVMPGPCSPPIGGSAPTKG